MSERETETPGALSRASMGSWRGRSCWRSDSRRRRSSTGSPTDASILSPAASTRSVGRIWTRRRRWATAVLAAAGGDHAALFPTQPYLGAGTALSHRSAAALWGIGAEQPGRIHLSVLQRAKRASARPARPAPSLAAPGRLRLVDDLPVTSPVQTLVDIASELGNVAIERAVNDADKRDLIDPEGAAARARRPRRRAGRAPTAPGPRPPHLPPLRLRPRDLLPPDRRRGGSPSPAQQAARQRLRGRLLLAGPRARGRDRRPPLPPHRPRPDSATRRAIGPTCSPA